MHERPLGHPVDRQAFRQQGSAKGTLQETGSTWKRHCGEQDRQVASTTHQQAELRSVRHQLHLKVRLINLN